MMASNSGTLYISRVATREADEDLKDLPWHHAWCTLHVRRHLSRGLAGVVGGFHQRLDRVWRWAVKTGYVDKVFHVHLRMEGVVSNTVVDTLDSPCGSGSTGQDIEDC
jgi:hypothetical protein